MEKDMFEEVVVGNCVWSSCKKLSTGVEVLVVKIYKYFHICTARATQLQSYCDEANAEYTSAQQGLLNYSLTVMKLTPRTYLHSKGYWTTVLLWWS
jgi:hypothetical protein